MKFQGAVKSVESLFIPFAIGIIKFELATVIEEPGPAVRFAAPRTDNLRLIATIETPAATCTCIHLALLSVGSRRMNRGKLESRRPKRQIRAAPARIPGIEVGDWQDNAGFMNKQQIKSGIHST